MDYRQEVIRLLKENTSLSESQIDDSLEVPPSLELGDFAFPCFSLTKELKKAPPVIAEDLVKKMTLSDSITRVENKGPYLNFFVNRADFNKDVVETVLRETKYYGKGKLKSKKVMIEYSQPNTHKAFHVGHLRNASLGDSIVRTMRAAGYKVTAANYIGDVGTHIAKCLWYYKKFNKEPLPINDKGEWLGKLYTAANKKLKDAEESDESDVFDKYKAEVSETLKLLEAPESNELIELWKETRQWSLDDFHDIYSWLNTDFDIDFFESDVEKEGKQLVEEFQKKGLFKESDGALIVDLKEYDLDVFLVLKSDGNSLYSTKDLALAAKKFREFDIDTSLYVVGSEQRMYFKQLFKTLELMGFERAKDCKHVAYELVMVPSGKMSSRDGNVVLFSQLKSQVMKTLEAEIRSRHDDWSDQKVMHSAKIIGVGALRFGMVSQDLNKTIVFDLNEWLSFEGETGPYIQYAVARINSIFRKSVGEIGEIDYALLNSSEEQKLVSKLAAYPEIVSRAADDQKPSLVARYVLDVAQDFNEFYHQKQILKAEGPLRGTRLSLALATKIVLTNGLNLLGIQCPEEM